MADDAAHRLDRIDLNILRILQEDGRIANVELARRVNLSPTPSLERVRGRGISAATWRCWTRSGWTGG